jgi:hypothetical protein
LAPGEISVAYRHWGLTSTSNSPLITRTLGGNSPPPWEHLFRGNFEAGMASVWENDDYIVSPLLFDMRRFFSTFRLEGDAGEYTNLLLFLAERKILEPTLFASLNYESALRAGLQPVRLSADLARTGQTSGHAAGSEAPW